jgi:hypothetical protein
MQHHNILCRLGCLGPGLSTDSSPIGPELCRILDMDFREILF